MTGETKASSGRREFMDHLIPVLTLLVIGYPLTRATIRAMLVSWLLVVVAITRSILRGYFQNNRVRYDPEDGDNTVSAAVVTGRSFPTGMLPEGEESWITSWT